MQKRYRRELQIVIPHYLNWLENYKNMSASTVKQHKLSLDRFKQFIQFRFKRPAVKLSSITISHYYDWMEEVRKKKTPKCSINYGTTETIDPNTIYAVASNLRSFFLRCSKIM
jgi:site-specific recombinase XerD